MTEVAVVILNYNGKELLEKFLPGVIQHSGHAKIIVADNGSTDDSIRFLTQHFSGVGIIRIPSNLGFCGGYNFALKKVDARYFILLNSDVEVTPAWINPLFELLDRNPRIAAVQPKILSYHQKHTFEYAGAGGGYIDSLAYPFCRGRIFNSFEEDRGQYDDQRPVFWASGACLFIRAELFHQMEGLDEDFFAHMEEIDLCWKLKRQGHLIYYEGKSVVYHVGGGTLSVHNPKKTYFNFRNGLFLMLRHMPFYQLAWKFPLRIVLDWIAALRFLFESPADAASVVRAHGSLVKHWGRTIQKRRLLRKQLRDFQVSDIYPGLLIINFFVLRQRRYEQLRNG